MSQDYHYQIVVGYDGKYPLDQYGNFLDPYDMHPVEGVFTDHFTRKVRGKNITVNHKRWKSARKVALSHVVHPEKLGKKNKFMWARELTNPYGSLQFAIGTGDDFWCFDYHVLEDGRVVLDATINSESGCFIMGGGYEVVSIAEAPTVAMNFVNQGLNWGGDNQIRHNKKGWNQDPYYFYRRVFYSCDPNKDKPDFSDHEFRFGGKKINKYCGIGK